MITAAHYNGSYWSRILCTGQKQDIVAL